MPLYTTKLLCKQPLQIVYTTGSHSWQWNINYIQYNSACQNSNQPVGAALISYLVWGEKLAFLLITSANSK